MLLRAFLVEPQSEVMVVVISATTGRSLKIAHFFGMLLDGQAD
jgi:hypothetical protein